jgi:t-SNARE complex subunit (syntaxin)
MKYWGKSKRKKIIVDIIDIIIFIFLLWVLYEFIYKGGKG